MWLSGSSRAAVSLQIAATILFNEATAGDSVDHLPQSKVIQPFQVCGMTVADQRIQQETFGVNKLWIQLFQQPQYIDDFQVAINIQTYHPSVIIVRNETRRIRNLTQASYTEQPLIGLSTESPPSFVHLTTYRLHRAHWLIGSCEGAGCLHGLAV